MKYLLAALALLLLSAEGASAQSRQPPQQPRAEKQRASSDQRGTTEQPLVVSVVPAEPNAEQANNQARERKRQETTDLWMILLTAGLFVAAAAQAWFAGVATSGLKYARRSAEAAEANITTINNTAKAQLRPYVYVERAELTDVKTTGPVTIHVYVKNGGVTPAYDMTHQLGSRLRPSDFSEFSLPPDVPLSKGTLGPGVTVQSTLQVKRDSWNSHAGGLMEGTTVLSVIGEIRYRDSFGDEHVTKYRYFMPSGPLRDGTLAVAQDGNHSD